MSIYAVNGKTPVAAWIPSLDTAGNGTTTLTDLVGSNNGTLTNMDEATDWVADTGAGGVRALDFDGLNDIVIAENGAELDLRGNLTLSGWYRNSVVPIVGFGYIVGKSSGNSNAQFLLGHNVGRLRFFAGGTEATTSSAEDLNWHHIVGVANGIDTRVYFDGALVSTGGNRGSQISTAPVRLGALGWTSNSINAKLDDIRIFDQALDAADVTALYAAGNGRGITFGEWDTPQSIAAVGDAVVSTEGTLVEARNLGQAIDQIVNGVTFVGATTAGTFTVGGGTFTATTVYLGGGIGAAFESMMDAAIFSGSSDVTRNIPLAGLTIGQSYLVQVFVSDSRTTAIANRRQSYTVAGHSLSSQRLGDELCLTCRFVASSTTENIGIKVDDPNETVPRIINGYQVRLLAASTIQTRRRRDLGGFGL